MATNVIESDPVSLSDWEKVEKQTINHDDNMIREARNKAFRYRLIGSGLPVILGLFLLGIWYIATPVGKRNPTLNWMMLLMPYVALFLIVAGPIILIIRAVFLRTFSGSSTNNPARVARRFYSEVLADNFPDWGTAFALIHPSARCAISPQTPDGLKNYWTQTRKACQTAAAAVCSSPFTCCQCGRTLAVFESMVLNIPYDGTAKQDIILKCIKCNLCICGECYSQMVKGDVCPKCQCKFSRGLWHGFAWNACNQDQLHFTVQDIKQIPRDENSTVLDCLVLIELGNSNSRRSARCCFHNGAIKQQGKWMLVLGMAGNISQKEAD